MIEIKNITKKYGNFTAIEDISFNVEKSSIYGLVGYNGAGKTTLLNILAALDKPTEGNVILDGNNLSKLKESQISAFRRDNLGFVFQDFNLLDTFTLEDNIYDNGEVRSKLIYVPDEVYFLKGASLERMAKFYKGYYPNFNDKVFKNMTEAMGLDSKKNIGSFSKGMQRQAEGI